MKLLLDTHIWIWSHAQPERLTSAVLREMEDSENELWLSSLSVWELVLLQDRRRLFLDTSIREWFANATTGVPFHEVSVTYEVALETRQVQLPHRDPIDRLLAATARVYDLTLVTADERLMGVKGLRVLANR